MSAIKLSYVLTTFNKLPYLRQVIDLLLLHVGDDEEIVVTDGGSIDGTKEYLEDLLIHGKISKYISEKDIGEAHGYNRAILMAKGEFIKIISDDDVYDYQIIQNCRKFLENNSSIDVIVGNNGTVMIAENNKPYLNPDMKEEFEKWKSGENNSFYCNGLTLLIRRASLPLLGLFNTNYLCIDLEFTIRTSIKANYAYCLQFIVTRIVNNKSNGSIYAERATKEIKQLCEIYNYPGPDGWKSRISDANKNENKYKWFSVFKKNKIPQTRTEQTKADMQIENIIIADVYNTQSQYLKAINSEIREGFIQKDSL